MGKEELGRMEREFNQSKNTYVAQREKERKKIARRLKEHGFKVTSGSGREVPEGVTGLVSDLSNWKWIQATKDDKYFYISLQAFDQDPNSGNFHVLMDRIGIFERKNVCKDTENAHYTNNQNFFNYIDLIPKEMKTTSIDLPMSDSSSNWLLHLLGAPEKEDWHKEPGANSTIGGDSNSSFTKIRSCYKDRRIEQIDFIKDSLKNEFEFKDPRGGLSSYFNRRVSNKPKTFDISNWRYLEGKKGGLDFFFSFQTFIGDPGAGHYRVAMDQIGIYVRKIGCDPKATNASKEMIPTDFNLPLSSQSFEELIAYIDEFERCLECPLKNSGNNKSSEIIKNKEISRICPRCILMLETEKHLESGG